MSENNNVETVIETVENEEVCENGGISVSSNFTYGYVESLVMEDVEARKLYINGEINESIMENITYYILKYNAVDKGVPVDERRPILLYINSCGGSCLAGDSCISTILASKTPIYTINIGYNFSMGLSIFLAGSKRYAYPDSSFLMHDGYDGIENVASKVIDYAKFMVARNKRTKNYILSRSNITSKKYDSIFREDWFFFTDEAKDYGFVQYVIGEDCDIDEIL